MTPRPELPHVPDPDTLQATRRVASQRWRIALLLTTTMVVTYFGFIALVAFAPGWLGGLLLPGVSRGIVFGALVIVLAWTLTWVYVRWANRVYDPALAALRARHAEQA